MQRKAVAANKTVRPLSPMDMNFELEAWLMRILSWGHQSKQPQSRPKRFDRNQLKWRGRHEGQRNMAVASLPKTSTAWECRSLSKRLMKELLSVFRLRTDLHFPPAAPPRPFTNPPPTATPSPHYH